MLSLTNVTEASADEKSNWREILNHFNKAVHIGMTATPKRDADSLDTYDYFGAPVYTYSLRQGIEDGFLAPYFVVRPILDIDVHGYTPKPGEVDVYGKILEQRKYTTSDFDRILTVEDRRKLVGSTSYRGTWKRIMRNMTKLFCSVRIQNMLRV